MKCRVCDKSKAPHRWEVRICADGRKKRTYHLCPKHDVELNTKVLSFFCIPQADRKMDAYAAKAEGEGV